MAAEPKALRLRSAIDCKYCPRCGKRTHKEERVVRSAMIQGRRVPTKKNIEVVCPEHGVITVG